MPLFTPIGIDGGQQRGPNSWDWPNYTAIQARLTRSANQSIASGTYTPVIWQSSMNGLSVGSPAWSDMTGLKCWDSATPSRLLIPITGWWAVGLHARFTTTATTVAQIEVVNSGGTRSLIARSAGLASAQFEHCASTIYPCGEGEYLELSVYQTSGSAQNLLTIGSTSPCLWAYLIGQI